MSLVLALPVVGGRSQAADEPSATSFVTSATVAVIGDSIIAVDRHAVAAVLTRAGVPPTVIDAVSGRATSYRTRYRGGPLIPSGIDAVRSIRRAGHRPVLWVVELGTNDRWSVESCRCADPVAAAGARIDRVSAEIGPGARILWVNVREDTPGAAAINEALRRRVGGSFGVIDWDATTRGRDELFTDDVHPNRDGSLVLGDLLARSILAALVRSVPDHCGAGSAPSSGGSGADLPSGHAVVTRPARRCSIP